jgi:hypothetical protein
LCPCPLDEMRRYRLDAAEFDHSSPASMHGITPPRTSDRKSAPSAGIWRAISILRLSPPWRRPRMPLILAEYVALSRQ